MAVWSGICVFSAIGVTIHAYTASTNKIAADDMTSGVICAVGVVLFCIWFFSDAVSNSCCLSHKTAGLA